MSKSKFEKEKQEMQIKILKANFITKLDRTDV